MFCPFRSAAKAADCSKDCALYTGSIDGKEPSCAIYSIANSLELSSTRLKEIEKDLDETAAGVTALSGKE